MPEFNEDAPCNVCGDELGMDSGHHVDYWLDAEGHPCHHACHAGLVEGALMAAERERDEARAEVERLRGQLAFVALCITARALTEPTRLAFRAIEAEHGHDDGADVRAMAWRDQFQTPEAGYLPGGAS